MAFKLPDLEYNYNDLEPLYNEDALKTHYLHHHSEYTDKFNEIIKDTPLEDKPPKEIFESISLNDVKIRNYGGGFFNHALFWKILCPEKKGKNLPNTLLHDDIVKFFGTYASFKNEFTHKALDFLGVGWIWLICMDDGELRISTTHNQDNPLMSFTNVRGTPLLALDLWEHAYYLNFKNDRNAYVKQFWKHINWDYIELIYLNQKEKIEQ